MSTVYTVGEYKVVIVSATYAIVAQDGKFLYQTRDIDDAIETAEEIDACKHGPGREILGEASMLRA